MRCRSSSSELYWRLRCCDAARLTFNNRSAAADCAGVGGAAAAPVTAPAPLLPLAPLPVLLLLLLAKLLRPVPLLLLPLLVLPRPCSCCCKADPLARLQAGGERQPRVTAAAAVAQRPAANPAARLLRPHARGRTHLASGAASLNAAPSGRSATKRRAAARSMAPLCLKPCFGAVIGDRSAAGRRTLEIGQRRRAAGGGRRAAGGGCSQACLARLPLRRSQTFALSMCSVEIECCIQAGAQLTCVRCLHCRGSGVSNTTQGRHQLLAPSGLDIRVYQWRLALATGVHVVKLCK